MAAAYVRLAKAAPRTTNFVTGATVMAVGDATVQVGVESKPLDGRRLTICSSYNALVSVPLAAWYALLDRRFPGTALGPLVPKVVVNQLVSSALLPLGFLAWSNGLPALFDGGGAAAAADAVAARLRLDYLHASITSFTVWLPANTFMFLSVPQAWRVGYLSVVGVAWGGYLSFVAHRQKPAR